MRKILALAILIPLAACASSGARYVGSDQPTQAVARADFFLCLNRDAYLRSDGLMVMCAQGAAYKHYSSLETPTYGWQ